MAYINNTYIFVQDEDLQRGVDTSEHPVESGLDLTDNIKRNPVKIYLKGEIVGKNAASNISVITALHHGGKLVKYSGRNILNNAIIEIFDTSHPIDIYGGCAFDMVLKEIRVAKPAYVEPKNKPTKSGTQQVQSNTDKKYHTVKKGDCLWNIAKAYYGNGAMYTKIYEANKSIIKNPNLIYPGQKFLIP